MTELTYPSIDNRLRPYGLRLRGGFRLDEQDLSLETNNKFEVLLLIGNIGDSLWAPFQQDTDAERSHPLDHWSKTHISNIANDLKGYTVFPSDGPPFHPFQHWAIKAEHLDQSPLGILIHPTYGLWHAYRGALLVSSTMDLPKTDVNVAICQECIPKPCLSSCPVDAIDLNGINTESCLSHLNDVNSCVDNGCLARLSCPVGKEYTYSREQRAFHNRAFLKSHSESTQY